MIQSPDVTLSVTDAARTRRSIRAFTSDPMPREDLEAILETVALAPSAFNAQPWRFLVVQDVALKAALAAAAFNQKQVTAAPAVIVVYSDVEDLLQSLPDIVHPGLAPEARAKTEAGVRAFLLGRSEGDRASWAAEQTNIALGFLMLAATGYGYQTSAMGGFNADAVKQVLGLPAQARISALVAIGTGAEAGFPHHRLPVARTAQFR